MRTGIYRFAVALSALCCLSAARAEVGTVAANGFIVTQQREIDATALRVYRAFVEDYGRWWNPEHSWSGDAANFSLDARPGGCLCEKLADGGGAMHMMVGYVEPGRVLRLVGGLGPLQMLGLSGTMNLGFVPSGARTLLKLEYRVAGFDPKGFVELAPLVDGVLHEQLTRLESYVETGAPVSTPARP